MLDENARQATLQKLIQEDAIGQLRQREGLMATLGSENGVIKLDWVEGVARLLSDSTQLETVEAEAREIVESGIRHIIWAGMGGSIITVRVLHELGFCTSEKDEKEYATIYPLDSTDPAALNQIVREIAAAKNLVLPADEETTRPAFLHMLLQDVMMIGVAMGMTSEEPITHLEWFANLLQQAELTLANHLLVMALPDSYLDRFAQEHRVPSRPLQPDGGTGTGGRMSAPTTRVFLFPVALYLTTHFPGQPGQLRSVLQKAWNEYNLELATVRPAEHPFVQLAAALSAASSNGACRLLLKMPEGWQALVIWLEQLMEESLGKGGKGIVVFDDQTLNSDAPDYHQHGTLRVHVEPSVSSSTEEHVFTLMQPSLASIEPREQLAALAASFLGWQLCMALYGYRQHIQFAGQPAVENYKARARVLRMQPNPLEIVSRWPAVWQDGNLTFLAPDELRNPRLSGIQHHPERAGQMLPIALAFARDLQEARALGYLDVTVNGEIPTSLLVVLNEHVRKIGNELLGVPVKVRQAPASYHSTEQSEMDGPPSLISLRLVAHNTEAMFVGSYTSTFLHAQAVSTWQAMMEVRRPCYLLVIDGTFNEAQESILTFFAGVEKYLTNDV